MPQRIKPYVLSVPLEDLLWCRFCVDPVRGVVSSPGRFSGLWPLGGESLRFRGGVGFSRGGVGFGRGGVGFSRGGVGFSRGVISSLELREVKLLNMSHKGQT